MSNDLQHNQISNLQDSNFEAVAGPTKAPFVDRRHASKTGTGAGFERRQFSDSHDKLSADAAELGRAVDQYKLVNRRKYVSYEELLTIVKSLGYQRNE